MVISRAAGSGKVTWNFCISVAPGLEPGVCRCWGQLGPWGCSAHAQPGWSQARGDPQNWARDPALGTGRPWEPGARPWPNPWAQLAGRCPSLKAEGQSLSWLRSQSTRRISRAAGPDQVAKVGGAGNKGPWLLGSGSSQGPVPWRDLRDPGMRIPGTTQDPHQR